MATQFVPTASGVTGASPVASFSPTDGSVVGLLDRSDSSAGSVYPYFYDDYLLTGILPEVPIHITFEAEFDPYLEILNADSLELVTWQRGWDANSPLTFPFLPRAGTSYRLRLSGWSEHDLGHYVLRVEPASTLPITATIDSVPGEWSGSLDFQDLQHPLLPGHFSEDILLKDLPAGAPVEVSLKSQFNGQLQILNAQTLELLAGDSQYSRGLDARVTVTPTAGANLLARVSSTYYIEVGAYTLRTLPGRNVDLVLASASAPSQGTVGEPLTVSWTVRNGGNSTALGGWADEIYLSDDPVYDGRDLELAFVGRGDHLYAGESYTATATASLLSTGKSGLNYLIFRANPSLDLAESNTANNQMVLEIDLDLNGPDLKASALNVPGVVGLGSSFDVSYRVDNLGAIAAQPSWTESIYISTDDVFDNGDHFLSERSVAVAGLPPLPAGGFRLHNERLTIPTGYSTGTNYLLLRVNPDRGLGENDLSNNTLAVPLLLGDGGPDLTVATASAPLSAGLGSRVDVSWTVANGGDAAAEATWTDQLWFSEDPVFGPDDLFLREVGRSSSAPLAAGERYTSRQSIRLPDSAKLGRNYLLVRANAGWEGSQGESSLANNDLALPIELTLDAPDLAVTATESPASGSVGRSIALSWSVTNTGSQAAAAQWMDTIYLSQDEIFSNDDLFLASEGIALPVPLAVGESYRRTKSVSLPSVSSAGRQYLLFQTNIYPDSDQGELSLANNQVAVPIDLDLNAPDLAILSATAPAKAVAGSRLDLSWQVTNTGLSPAEGTWVDNVFLSRDPYYDYADTYLGSSDPSGYLPLAVGASYSQARSFSLPGSGFAGNNYLIFRANPYGQQPEINTINNDLVLPIEIDPNGPDLQPLTLTAPSQARVGALLNLAWTVKNRGAAATDRNWLDQLYLSADTVLDGSDLMVASYYRYAPAPLAAGDTYTYSQTVSLPKGNFDGPGYLILAANANSEQPETDSTNNRLVVPIDIDPAGPDLVLESVMAPASASVGGLVPLSWKVVNGGVASAEANWMDDVYLSEDDKFDWTDRYLIAQSINEQTPLEPGDHYVLERSVVIPRVAKSGPHYLLFRTNNRQEQGETSLANNLLAKPITIDFNSPDLQVLSAIGPEQAEVGSTIDVGWTVLNGGDAPALGNFWYDWIDTVVLSADPIYDAGDKQLASVSISDQAPLAAGQSYSQTQRLTLPEDVVGANYLVFHTNAYSLQVELSETNNDRAIPITISGQPSITLTHFANRYSQETGPTFTASALLSQKGDEKALKARAVETCTIDMGGPQSTLDNTVRIHSEVTSSGAPADVVGLSNSTLRLRDGKDDLVVDALLQGPGAGESVAVRNSLLSGNRGDDVITLVGDVWGERALVFGGAGNDTISGYGIGRDSFIQAGAGDDVVSVGQMESTPGAAWLQRPNGDLVRPSTVRGGEGWDVLQLREVLQGDFETQAVWFSVPGEEGWLFRGTHFSGFEQISFG